jgi:hypothetical protein
MRTFREQHAVLVKEGLWARSMKMARFLSKLTAALRAMRTCEQEGAELLIAAYVAMEIQHVGAD